MAPSSVRSLPFLLVIAAAFAQLAVVLADPIRAPVTQLPIDLTTLAAQAQARAAYFSSQLNGGSPKQALLTAQAANNFAATPVGLGGGYNALGTFLVNVTLGLIRGLRCPWSQTRGAKCAGFRGLVA